MFKYIYGDGCRKFNFYRIPQALFTDERLKMLSNDSKVLYGLMLDRAGLSVKKHWTDDQGRVYIIFTNAEVCDKLNVGTHKAVKVMKELETIGLIDRKRIGLGRPDRIFVKHFCSDERAERNVENSVPDNVESSENSGVGLQNPLSQNCENHNPAEVENASPKEQKSQELLYNQTNKAILSESYHIKSDHSDTTDLIETQTHNKAPKKSAKEMLWEREYTEERIKENIEYDWWQDMFKGSSKDRPNGSIEELNEIICLMVETICSPSDTVRVGKTDYPKAVVESRFMKIRQPHIEYVFDMLAQTTTKICNIKAYLITCLYNSTLTIKNYESADFRYVFPQYAVR